MMNSLNGDSRSSSRRDFFKKSSLAALGLAGGSVAVAEKATVKKTPRSGKAKNIIFLVSDGMSHGTLAMADQLLQMRDGRRSHWMDMYRSYPVRRGLMDMASANALVTDSAAASSSWGCGQRVPNGRVNVDGSGQPHEPILQIEAARVDHAAHINDISGLLYEQIAFDEAVNVALRFYEQNPDTMVIVTTDHGNANPGLNSGGGLGDETLGRVMHFKGSCSGLLRLLNPNAREGIDEIRESIRAITGFGISKEQARLMVDFRTGDWIAPYSQIQAGGMLGQILANYTHVGWNGRSHTSDYVEVSAVGPGSERINPFMLNTDMFDVMCKALDLDVG